MATVNATARKCASDGALQVCQKEAHQGKQHFGTYGVHHLDHLKVGVWDFELVISFLVRVSLEGLMKKGYFNVYYSPLLN